MSQCAPIGAVIVPVTPFQQNCSLVWCARTMKGAVVDPGGEIDRVVEVAGLRGITIEKILVTHGHLDHAGAVADLAARLGVPVEGPHESDTFWIDQLGAQGGHYGMSHCRPFVSDRWLEDEDTVTVGEQEFRVRHCPGHTPGHIVFHHEDAKLAWVGDVLFQGSVGRTDIPMGDHATLVASIRDRLWPLGGDVRFVPGHGPISTFGAERETNPFVADRVLSRH